MRLTNRLATQASRGYNSFISLFKYKSLLAILMLLGVAINAVAATAVYVNKHGATAGGNAKVKAPSSDKVVDITTEVTNTIGQNQNKLQDALVYEYNLLDMGGCVLYLGVQHKADNTKVVALDYTNDTNPFEIDISHDSTKPSLGYTANTNVAIIDSIEVYPNLAQGLKLSSSNIKQGLTLTNGLNIHKGERLQG